MRLSTILVLEINQKKLEKVASSSTWFQIFASVAPMIAKKVVGSALAKVRHLVTVSHFGVIAYDFGARNWP